MRRASLRPKRAAGSKPLTSAANRVSRSEASNKVIGPTPDRPLQTASQVEPTSLPSGVMQPMPVMTTRLRTRPLLGGRLPRQRAGDCRGIRTGWMRFESITPALRSGCEGCPRPALPAPAHLMPADLYSLGPGAGREQDYSAEERRAMARSTQGPKPRPVPRSTVSARRAARVVSLTHPLHEAIPVWPGHPYPSVEPVASYAANGFLLQRITLG